MDEERKETTQEPATSNNSVDTNSSSPFPTEKSPNPKRFPWKVVLIAAAVLCAVLITLCATHVICLSHNWQAATCTEPEICSKCHRTRGESLGHDFKPATCTKKKTCRRCGAQFGMIKGHEWIAATCTAPETCSVCGTISGAPLGHSASDWEIETPATLNQNGTAVKTCTRCGEIVDTGTYSKEPEVLSDGYNFTEDEIVTYLRNQISSNYSIWPIPSQDREELSDYAMYPIVDTAGDLAALMLIKVDESGAVTQLGIAGENSSLVIALAAWMAQQIDPKFDTDSAATLLTTLHLCIDCNMKLYAKKISDTLFMATVTPY